MSNASSPPITHRRGADVARTFGTVARGSRHGRPVIRSRGAASVAVMSADPRTSLGRLGERLAADHFERLGWRIVARNHHTRFGELDLIATDGDTLVFCEVKTCRLGRGRPWDSLHARKQVQVRRMAGLWFKDVKERPYFAGIRFDAIGVVIDDRDTLVRLDHLQAAF